jgi:hypothetical protein
MDEVRSTTSLRKHTNYAHLADLATSSHLRGRDPKGVSNQEISLARLYSYAFRAHIIGAFHSTRQAVAAIHSDNLLAHCQLLRASESLATLANRSMDEVGHDVRALLSTFNLYSTHVGIVLDALDSACELEKSAILQVPVTVFEDIWRALHQAMACILLRIHEPMRGRVLSYQILASQSFH